MWIFQADLPVSETKPQIIQDTVGLTADWPVDHRCQDVFGTCQRRGLGLNWTNVKMWFIFFKGSNLTYLEPYVPWPVIKLSFRNSCWNNENQFNGISGRSASSYVSFPNVGVLIFIACWIGFIFWNIVWFSDGVRIFSYLIEWILSQ